MNIVLPLPPGINRTYGVGINRSGSSVMYKNTSAKLWEEEAGWTLKKVWHEKPMEGPVEMEIHWFYKDDRDIDAGLKLLLDLFQKQGVYLDDRQVRKITNMTIDEDRTNPRVEVTINKIYG